MEQARPRISIIIPMYNEDKNVLPIYHELKQVLSGLGKPFEIIIIDDGSTDNTVNEASSISDGSLKVFSFTKNCGKSAALSFGFSRATGDVIVMIDGDLQDDPADIPKFIAALDKHEVVCGWRHERKDRGLKRLWSKVYNVITRSLFGICVHDMNCGFKAFRSYTLKNLKLYGEMHRYILVLLKKQGFLIGEIKVHHRPRVNGVSKYGGNRILNGLLDLISIALITSRYGQSPLHFFGRLSLMISSVGLIPVLYTGYQTYIGATPTDVFTLAGITLIVSGIITFIMGLGFEMVVSSVDPFEPTLKG